MSYKKIRTKEAKHQFIFSMNNGNTIKTVRVKASNQKEAEKAVSKKHPHLKIVHVTLVGDIIERS